jgi:hypothetical protein
MLKPSTPDKMSNVDIIVLAAYLCGAHITPADTEDIAMTANSIAPGRFAWKKYKDQINLEHVRVYLTDARKADKGQYIEGSIATGWSLTREGVARALALEGKVGSAKLTPPKNIERKKNEVWLERERARMLSSSLIARFKTHGSGEITRKEIEAFFKLDEYIQGEARQKKIERWIMAFNNDPKLFSAIEEFAKKLNADKE